MSNLIECRAYKNLRDSNDDSARAIFFDNEDGCLYGVTLGPGFNPDGSNQSGWLWGSKQMCDCNETGMDLWITEYLDGENVENPVGTPWGLVQELEEFSGPDVKAPFWNDEEKVLKVMRFIITNESNEEKETSVYITIQATVRYTPLALLLNGMADEDDLRQIIGADCSYDVSYEHDDGGISIVDTELYDASLSP